MSKDYNARVAAHYSRYRPPLHEMILRKAIGQDKRFEIGLDIGCGTGKSSKPLSQFCNTVVGIDPSQFMIDNAVQDPSIDYICSNSLAQFHDDNFDIVTFAGSLSYAKNESLRFELSRICQDQAFVLVYDFEVLFSDLSKEIGLSLSPINLSGYNHSINISDWKEFKEGVVCNEQLDLNPSADELGHLILSHSTWHDELTVRFRDDDPFAPLVSYLKSTAEKIRLPVNIFYSAYKSSKIRK